MSRIVVIAAALLIGTAAPAIARHRHYRHVVHRHSIERHHHSEVAERIHSKTPVQSSEHEVTTPAPKEIDPEALAWVYPKEHFDDRPRKLVGKLVVAGAAFPFVSGGHGWSIPWGHWPVTPNEVGSWGVRHGAIGLNNGDDIPDPKLHRGREGVEIHAANHEATAGCVGILERYSELKKMVLSMVDKFGHAWLHVTPQAVAITPSRYLAGKVGEVVAAKDDDDEPVIRKRRNAYNHHRHTRMASR